MFNEKAKPIEVKKFGVPMGFSFASGLSTGGEATTVQEQRARGLTGGMPGKYALNNDTIAAVTSDGEIIVWIPKADRNASRTVSYEEAIQNLKKAGYTEGAFNVPFS